MLHSILVLARERERVLFSMGNVAIAFIEGLISFTDNVKLKKQRQIEYKRIRTIIPRALAQLNNQDTSITTLDLSGLGVDLNILRLLSLPLIAGETRVEKLFLDHNNIGSEGATCIARIMSRDRHLLHVSLAYNPGEFPFALLLPCPRMLLSTFRCSFSQPILYWHAIFQPSLRIIIVVGSVGVVAIASALEQNVSINRLDLSYCEIDDRGMQKMSISLQSNTTLHFLNIEGNYLSSSGMQSLLKCVYDTTSIRSLWESNHSIRAFYGQRSIYSPR